MLNFVQTIYKIQKFINCKYRSLIDLNLFSNKHIQNKPTDKQINIATEWCKRYNLELNKEFIFKI